MTDRNNAWAAIANAIDDDCGAVTVDWIVLTASLVFMGIAAAFYVSSSVPEVADNISEYMKDVEVGAPSDS
jgi:uncharacterized membrane protein YczE